MSGRLSLVGTPIGNLGDITYRAVQRLNEVSRIYAEDTRRTRSLLGHLGIEGKRVLSLHAHSSGNAIAAVVQLLVDGDDLALVTDAGMPGVSDPGAELVRAARLAAVVVDVIPGPSAVTAAVALSGLVDSAFLFLGFLPRKGKKRAEALREISQSKYPVVLFESPHRIKDTLSDFAEICEGTRLVAVCREVTKKFEETLVLPLADLCHPEFREVWQGEFTLVVDKSARPGKTADQEIYDADARALALLKAGQSVKDAVSVLAAELAERGDKTSRRDLYSRVLLLAQSPEQELARA